MKVSKSVLMAVAVTVAVTLWMLTGLIGAPGSASQTPRNNTVANPAPVALTRVAVQVSQATTMVREIVVSARTEPNRMVELRAETDGRVVELGAERGAVVKAGEKIAVLDMRDRRARLLEAKAIIVQMELQLAGARKLQDQQFVSETQIAEANARVVSAHAALETIELDISYTMLVAPFDAVMQERMVELGDFINSGDSIAHLVDIDPLIVVGEINERGISNVEVGGVGYARLVNGDTVEGRIRYIAPIANENTRTFRIELAIPNKDGVLRAGMTAKMNLAGDMSTVHFFSPALLTLDDDGIIGVKTVDNSDRVKFYPVEIVGSTDNGISVSGLPDVVRLIIVGQGFVKTGDRVEPVINPTAVGLSKAQSNKQSANDAYNNIPSG